MAAQSFKSQRWAESVAIWVVNKGRHWSLGLFAWDRAVNDIAHTQLAISTQVLTISSLYVTLLTAPIDDANGLQPGKIHSLF